MEDYDPIVQAEAKCLMCKMSYDNMNPRMTQ